LAEKGKGEDRLESSKHARSHPSTTIQLAALSLQMETKAPWELFKNRTRVQIGLTVETPAGLHRERRAKRKTGTQKTGEDASKVETSVSRVITCWLEDCYVNIVKVSEVKRKKTDGGPGNLVRSERKR